jgi:hypothetical protein
MQPALAQAHTASNNVGGAMFTRVQAYLARDRERRDRIVEGRQFRLRQERDARRELELEREIDEGHIHGDACELCPLDCAD